MTILGEKRKQYGLRKGKFQCFSIGDTVSGLLCKCKDTHAHEMHLL